MQITAVAAVVAARAKKAAAINENNQSTIKRNCSKGDKKPIG